MKGEFSQGLLDLSVELSTSNVTAGNEFAMFVLVKNPFKHPVNIHEVNVSLPSELIRANENKVREDAEKARLKLEENLKENRREEIQIKEKLDSIEQHLLSVNNLLNTNSVEAQELALLTDLLRSQTMNMQTEIENLNGRATVGIYGGSIGTIKVGSNSATVGVYNENGKVGKVEKIEVYEPWLIHEEQAQSRTIKLNSSLPEEASLQPGSTAVYTAILNVKRSLIFTPSQYRLQFYVNYGFDEYNFSRAENENLDVFTNTVAHDLSIRPSVYSILFGSGIGGLIGGTARILQLGLPLITQDSIVTIIVALILSGMSIIFLARKSDTQSFVSVEDFWGGLLIGFLVGYTGTAFFESLTGIASP